MIVAVNAFYVNNPQEWVIDLAWLSGVVLGIIAGRSSASKMIRYGGLGGGAGVLSIVPSMLAVELQTHEIAILDLSFTEGFTYLVLPMLIIPVIGFIGGALLGLVFCPARSLILKYVEIVDQCSRNMTRRN